MPDFHDLLRPDAIVVDASASNKKALLLMLGTVAAGLIDGDGRMIADRLAEREKLGSTGFGGGVAIPHAKIPGLQAVTGLVARLAQPIEFAAVDAMPVDLVFALLSPADAGADHLKALARVSRRMRDRAFVAKLRGAGSRDALFALFTADEGQGAG